MRRRRSSCSSSHAPLHELLDGVLDLHGGRCKRSGHKCSDHVRSITHILRLAFSYASDTSLPLRAVSASATHIDVLGDAIVFPLPVNGIVFELLLELLGGQGLCGIQLATLDAPFRRRRLDEARDLAFLVHVYLNEEGRKEGRKEGG